MKLLAIIALLISTNTAQAWVNLPTCDLSKLSFSIEGHPATSLKLEGASYYDPTEVTAGLLTFADGWNPPYVWSKMGCESAKRSSSPTPGVSLMTLCDGRTLKITSDLTTCKALSISDQQFEVKYTDRSGLEWSQILGLYKTEETQPLPGDSGFDPSEPSFICRSIPTTAETACRKIGGRLPTKDDFNKLISDFDHVIDPYSYRESIGLTEKGDAQLRTALGAEQFSALLNVPNADYLWIAPRPARNGRECPGNTSDQIFVPWSLNWKHLGRVVEMRVMYSGSGPFEYGYPTNPVICVK